MIYFFVIVRWIVRFGISIQNSLGWQGRLNVIGYQNAGGR